MAAWNKFNQYVLDKLSAKHDFTAAGHVMKLMLTNTAPVATNTIKANITEISAGNGYTAGGTDVQNDVSQTSGTATITAVDVTWTATGGSIGPFRYVVAYNDTQTTPAKPLIGWYDIGSSITVTVGNQFSVDFGASWLTDV